MEKNSTIKERETERERETSIAENMPATHMPRALLHCPWPLWEFQITAACCDIVPTPQEIPCFSTLTLKPCRSRPARNKRPCQARPRDPVLWRTTHESSLFGCGDGLLFSYLHITVVLVFYRETARVKVCHVRVVHRHVHSPGIVVDAARNTVE